MPCWTREPTRVLLARWALRLVSLALVAAAFGPLVCRAQARHTVRFVWLSEAREPCPDQTAFREIVAARLGWEPFDDAADRSVEVRIENAGRGRVRVRATLRAGDGEPLGDRVVEGRLAQCVELCESAALAIAVAVDPLTGDAASGDAQPEAASSPEPVQEEAPLMSGPETQAVLPPDTLTTEVLAPDAVVDSEPVPAAPEPLHIDIAVEGSVRAWMAPNPMLGGSARVALRGDHWSIHAGPGLSTTVQDFETPEGDRISARYLGGLLGGCGRLDVAIGCASVAMGAYEAGAPTVSQPSVATAFYAEVQMELGIEWLIAAPIGVRMVGLVAIPLTPVELAIDESVVYSMPPVSAGLSLGVFARVL